jgi:hypothetical protein
MVQTPESGLFADALNDEQKGEICRNLAAAVIALRPIILLYRIEVKS